MEERPPSPNSSIDSESYLTIKSEMSLPEKFDVEEKDDSFFPKAQVPIGRCTKMEVNQWWLFVLAGFITLLSLLLVIFLVTDLLGFDNEILSKFGPNTVHHSSKNFDVIFVGEENYKMPFPSNDNSTSSFTLAMKSQELFPFPETKLYWQDGRCKVMNNKVIKESCYYVEKDTTLGKSLSFLELATFDFDNETQAFLINLPVVVQYSMFLSNQPFGPWESIIFNRTFDALSLP